MTTTDLKSTSLQLCIITTDLKSTSLQLCLTTTITLNAVFQNRHRPIRSTLQESVHELIDDHIARGGTLARPAEVIQVSALAWVQGLALEWIERGTTPALLASLDALRAWLEHASGPPTA